MNTNEYTRRSRFTLRVAAAITGNDPWAKGYSQHVGTYRSLKNRLPAIRRDHGGNTVEQWFYHGTMVSRFSLDTYPWEFS